MEGENISVFCIMKILFFLNQNRVKLWTFAHDGKPEQIAAQIVNRIEQRIAAGIEMILPKPKGITALGQCEDIAQCIAALGNKKVGECVSNSNALVVF